MSIINPSQYDCDNSQKGDLVIIKRRPKLYKWYRDRFLKDKIKLKIRQRWDSDDRIEVYQEDCTLVFKWEIQGKSEYVNEVPYILGFNNKYSKYGKRLQTIQFGSENISIVTKHGLSLLIPTMYVRSGLDKLDNTRKNIDEERQIQQALKFARYKGDFFKKRCKELNLDGWSISYCSVCGKPLRIEFDKEEPYINNTCDCGNTVVENKDITWNTVAYIFNSQTQQYCANRYKEFWKI